MARTVLSILFVIASIVFGALALAAAVVTSISVPAWFLPLAVVLLGLAVLIASF